MKPKPQEKTKKATDHSTQRHWREMNRKQRREMMRKIQSEDISLEVVHPDAAGIDIGNESHYVAVPPSRNSQPVRRFGCTTAELKAMADWLKQCGIRTVAMQSTGVYWIAVYDILEEAGLEVYLVNARETKNLPGRKTDVRESQWLMKLHTYGLLRNSFRPSHEIRMMRTYWRQRNDLVQSAGRHIQRMQKALTQMNIQLASQCDPRSTFLACARNFAHRFLAAFPIFALAAADNTRFFAPFSSRFVESLRAFAAARTPFN